MLYIVQVQSRDLKRNIVEQICDLLLPEFRKNGIGDSCNSFEFQHMWDTLLKGERPAALFLFINDKRVCGLLGGVTFDDPLTGLRYAAEVVWCIDPEYRGMGWGTKLLQSFENWAKLNDCSRVVIHVSSRRLSNCVPSEYFPYQIEFLKEL